MAGTTTTRHLAQDNPGTVPYSSQGPNQHQIRCRKCPRTSRRKGTKHIGRWRNQKEAKEKAAGPTCVPSDTERRRAKNYSQLVHQHYRRQRNLFDETSLAIQLRVDEQVHVIQRHFLPSRRQELAQHRFRWLHHEKRQRISLYSGLQVQQVQTDVEEHQRHQLPEAHRRQFADPNARARCLHSDAVHADYRVRGDVGSY